MKTYGFVLLLALSALVGSLNGSEILLEAKAGYFGPTNHTFQDIYSGSGIYGAEMGYCLGSSIYAWGSADYFYKDGHSKGRHHPTRIELVPLAFGLKYFFPFKCVDVYVGAGAQCTHLEIKDHSHFVIHHISKWGWGGIVKGGVLVNLKKAWFLDCFANYSFLDMDFHNTHHHKVTRHDAHLSGWTVGLGLGRRFGVHE